MQSNVGLFLALFLYRYLRLIVNVFAFTRFRPTAISENPRVTPQDVTIIIPTIDGHGPRLWDGIVSMVKTEPAEIILVTTHANHQKAEDMVKQMKTPRIRVLSISHPNKRAQMVRAMSEVTTAITVLADDDVLWPRRILYWMLSPFDDSKCGGVGTNQRLRRAMEPTLTQRLYGYLNALYLERRNFDCAACMYMDGGIPCLSGRTVAYRTKILQDESFIYHFTHEDWLGIYRLSADDDNFITRWLLSHDMKIAFQYHKEAEVLTTLEDNAAFLKQCLRWSRSNWRSNLTSMFWDRHIWQSQLWTTYAVHQTTILHWAILSDGLLFFTYYQSTQSWASESRLAGLIALLAWMLFSKFVKLLGHYIRYPADFFLLPVSIVFGYLHGFIKAKAMLSLDVTAWGTRNGADDYDAHRMVKLTPKMHQPVSPVRYDAAAMLLAREHKPFF